MGQYIGARYVPDVTGAVHDPTQIYENMVVVNNGMGTSYISRKPVPAGVPLTDTEYWAIYGASSGAIINLQNQINNMQDGTVPGSLQNQINDNTSDIAALTNNLPLVNVLNYGATGDGVTDDYTAFANALAYCKNNNLKMYVPPKTYKLSQYIFTDEEFVYSDLGTYTNAKLIFSKSIKKGSLNMISSLTLDATTIFGSNAELQSVIWNDTLGCYTFFGWDRQSTPGSIATITNVDSLGNVINTTTKPYGLINDAIYYPINNTILFSGSNSGNNAWSGKIIEINASDFSVINTYDSGVDIIYEIAYDSINEIIYSAGKKTGTTTWQFAILDTELNILKQYPDANVIIHPYTDASGFNYEGSCIINGQFMLQSFNNERTILSSYNLDDATIKNYLVIPKTQYRIPENAFVKDGYLYIACYQDNNLILEKYSLDIVDTLSYTDGQIAFFHQQSVKLVTSGGSLQDRIVDYAENIAFSKGLNIVEVQETDGRVRGVFFMAISAPGTYGSGIFIGYYTDYVYRVHLVGGTYSCHQLAEV